MDWALHMGKVEEVREAMERNVKARRRRRRRAVKGGAGAAILAALVLWGIPTYRDTGTTETEPARRESVTLEDGTRADLNAHTSFRTDFRYHRRRVELSQGEAFFKVAKDPAHPFRIVTPSGTIEVTGTEFNVRLDAQGTEVTLVEGQVRFTAPGELSATTLRPGDQLVSDGSKIALRTLGESQLTRVLSWRTGHLALEGLTLGEAAARFGTYYGKTISVAPELANLPLGGTCSLDDLPGFLAFLKDAFPIVVREKTDGSLELGPR